MNEGRPLDAGERGKFDGEEACKARQESAGSIRSESADGGKGFSVLTTGVGSLVAVKEEGGVLILARCTEKEVDGRGNKGVEKCRTAPPTCRTRPPYRGGCSQRQAQLTRDIAPHRQQGSGAQSS
jgi:hypothetical protein